MSPLLVVVLLLVLAGLGAATWKAPRLTAILGWSLLATILSSAAILLVLPVDFGQLALWLTLFVPVLWVVLQFLCYWDRSKWRMPAFLIVLSFVSAATIAFVPPPV